MIDNNETLNGQGDDNAKTEDLPKNERVILEEKVDPKVMEMVRKIEGMIALNSLDDDQKEAVRAGLDLMIEKGKIIVGEMAESKAEAFKSLEGMAKKHACMRLILDENGKYYEVDNIIDRYDPFRIVILPTGVYEIRMDKRDTKTYFISSDNQMEILKKLSPVNIDPIGSKVSGHLEYAAKFSDNLPSDQKALKIQITSLDLSDEEAQGRLNNKLWLWDQQVITNLEAKNDKKVDIFSAFK